MEQGRPEAECDRMVSLPARVSLLSGDDIRVSPAPRASHLLLAHRTSLLEQQMEEGRQPPHEEVLRRIEEKRVEYELTIHQMLAAGDCGNGGGKVLDAKPVERTPDSQKSAENATGNSGSRLGF